MPEGKVVISKPMNTQKKLIDGHINLNKCYKIAGQKELSPRKDYKGGSVWDQG